ncbi:MAG: exonuclease SbcCD subunit D C-terminal domain-containing protein [Bacteroidales bacterium]|nr:exonuclease SbcCD subunit D C-terminal domain-containing protein [Bacteroidales bacterium]
MRIIHTADWHLGQTFHDFDRKREHLHFLGELKRRIGTYAADVLLIAGDVFDSPNPPADAQEMLYRFLHEAIAENPQLQVIIIAGNHDSAGRLEAPNPLLKLLNITVRGVVRRDVNGEIDYSRLIVPLTQGGQTVAWCLAVPYLRYGDYPPAENYTKGVEQMFLNLYERIPDKRLPVVAMGHLQASGSELSANDKSERVVVGGLEGVSPEVFSRGFAYTALGHLHRTQKVSGHENIRYAGSPLPMSFAETGNRQNIILVEIDGKQTHIETAALSPLTGLRTIRASSVQDALQQIAGLPEGDNADADYLEIRVRIGEPEPSLPHRIEEALKGKAVRLARLAALPHENTTSAIKQTVASFEELQRITPMHMATEAFKRQYGGDDMPQAIKTILQQVINEAENL